MADYVHVTFLEMQKIVDESSQELDMLLSDLYEKIRDIDRKELKYAYIVEYNKFIKIRNTLMAGIDVDNNIRTVQSILNTTEKYRKTPDYIDANIGDELSTMLSIMQKTNDPDIIKKIINIVKESDQMMSFHKKKDIICEINKSIIERNKVYKKHGEDIPHGIIIQLRKNPKGFITQVALLCSVKCKVCGAIMQFSGNTMLDVYGPCSCVKCGSVDLYAVPWRMNETDSKKNVTPPGNFEIILAYLKRRFKSLRKSK